MNIESKIKHILLNGVLKCGGKIFVFFLVGTYFFSFPTTGPIDTNWIVKNLLIWTTVGIIEGIATLKNK